MLQVQAATLPIFGVEQAPLPGIGRGLRLVVSPPAEDEDPSPQPIVPGPGQLCLECDQMLVWDAAPEPTQPSLLSDPPLWETAFDRLPTVAPAGPARRPRRTRRRAGGAADQLLLFS